MEVYIIYTTTYVCKQRVVALLLMELLSKMRKMRTITPPDAISFPDSYRGFRSIITIYTYTYEVSFNRLKISSRISFLALYKYWDAISTGPKN